MLIDFICDEFVKITFKHKHHAVKNYEQSSLWSIQIQTNHTIKRIQLLYQFREKARVSSLKKQVMHKLKSRILDLSSFDQFHSFFNEKRNQFDPSCYSIASRALAKILMESKLIYNFQHRQSLKNFLVNLQKIDVEVLNLSQFSNLLYLLRTIKLDPNNNNNFVGLFIRSILERSESKVKELELDTSLNRLCYFYQEYCGLASRSAHTIAKRINIILKETNSEVQSQKLSVPEINLLLKGMKSKNQLSSEQLYLFRSIIKNVLQKHLEELSFLELAQISTGINQVMSNNSETTNIGQAQQIHKKILQNIDQMDEKSIMYILNSKKTNNKIYGQIYKIIFEKILDQIQPNGQSSFNELFTLRLFNGIANKVKLKSASPANQDKFFAFLKQTITKTPRFIHSFIENYVEKGFFNSSHLLKLVQILESIPDFHFKLSLLHELSVRKVDIEKIFQFDQTKEIQFRDKNLIIMSTICENFIDKNGPNKEKYIETLRKLKERFFQLYNLEDETFSRLMFNLDNRYILSLAKSFRKQIEAKFPNPFETEQSQKYRNAWLKYQIYGSPEQHFIKKQINSIKQTINKKDIDFVFRIIAIEKYTNKQTLSNVLTLASKCLKTIIADSQLTFNMCKLMSIQISAIFDESNSQIVKMRYWQILSQCMQKMQPQKYFQHFTSITHNILKSNIYDFKYSQQYKTYLQKVLKKAQVIRSKYLITDVLRECLRLNLIKREDIPNLSPKVRESATQQQNVLLKMIQTNQFALEGVQITKNNLSMFLFNLSPDTLAFLDKNQEKVFSLIEQMKPRQLWKCICHYRLGSKKKQSLILDTLFKKLNTFNIYFEQNSPVFLGEILRRNNFQKYPAKIDNIKTFIRNSLEYFTQRHKIGKISLEEHIGLMRTANDFKINNDEYMHAVLEKNYNQNTIWTRQLYLTCGNIGIQLNQKQIHRLVTQRNFFVNFNSSFSKCLNIFLLYEKQLTNPGAILQSIVNKYNQMKFNQKIPVYSIYYQYLRKNYSEETKNFEPNNIDKADFCKSLEFINSKNLHLMRQIFEDVTQTKWVENNIHSNFYYTFRNFAFLFPVQSKYHGQNLLIKRILKELTGIDKFILINKRHQNLKSTVKYITINYQNCITPEQQEKIYKRLIHQYNKDKETTEVSSQEHEQHGQGEQPNIQESKQTKN